MPQASREFDLPDAHATAVLGRSLARSLPSAPAAGCGAVLYLQGDLGAGKTSCVREFLRVLGVTGLVRSPTYTLVETYTVGACSYVHVDLYRLKALSEVDELGLRDLQASSLLVEWPERGQGALPPADLVLRLSYAGEGRHALLLAHSMLATAWLENLAYDTSLAPYVSNLT
jgi:tRNA threonylcarbamoyl adenosine modification protein YjeE